MLRDCQGRSELGAMSSPAARDHLSPRAEQESKASLATTTCADFPSAPCAHFSAEDTWLRRTAGTIRFAQV